MIQEASMEEWKVLYETATGIKERKPWEEFWDMDLIGIQEAEDKEPVFFNILGKNGECFGIIMYEGLSGLNNFFLLADQEKLNVSAEYAVFSQNNLACYWGNREELTDRQREVVKELGYKYHGKNQWLYFVAHNDGYFPNMLNREEVKRMTKALLLFVRALDYWEENPLSVDFAHGNMYLYAYDAKEEQWQGKEQPLPFTEYQFSHPKLTDALLLEALKQAKRGNYRLEAEIDFWGVPLGEKHDDGRTRNHKVCLIADADSRRILKADIMGEEAEAAEWLIQYMVDFILGQGAPEEILVSSQLVAAILRQIGELAGITITQKDVLSTIKSFMADMKKN